MASIPHDNWTSFPDEGNAAMAGDEDYQHDYYYYYDGYDDDADSVHWPYLVFDVVLCAAVVVDLLLAVVALSARKLRRGPSAVFIISLAGFDMLHLISIRLSLYVMQQYEMHPAGHLICKVT